MKDLTNTSTTEFFQSIQDWINSLTGTLTILIILAAIGVIATMAAKESYGKGSFGHRTVRVITITLYTVIAVNLADTFIRHILSLTWLTTSLLILICASLIYLAFTKVFKAKLLSAISYTMASYVILVGGIQGIYHDGYTTFSIGFISFFVYVILIAIISGVAATPNASSANTQNNATCETSTELLDLTAEKLAAYIIEHQAQSNLSKDISTNETESSSAKSETTAHDNENVSTSDTQSFIDALLEKTDFILQKYGMN